MNDSDVPDQTRPPEHVNLFFRLAIAAGGAFVVTILALVATLFGDSQSPVAQMLGRHAGKIFVVEVIALVVFGVMAMAVDRRQTLRSMQSAATIAPPDVCTTAAEAKPDDATPLGNAP